MNRDSLRAGRLYQFVVTFLRREGEVLMAMKPKGDKLVDGCWNGYGGKVDPIDYKHPEPFLHAACREMREESGGVTVKPENLTKVVVIDFSNALPGGGEAICRVHGYEAWKFEGTPRTTIHMQDPNWFKETMIGTMGCLAPVDKIWMPRVFFGREKIRGFAWYSSDQRTSLREPEFKVISSFRQFDSELETEVA